MTRIRLWRILYVLRPLLWVDTTFQPCAVFPGWHGFVDRVVEWAVPA